MSEMVEAMEQEGGEVEGGEEWSGSVHDHMPLSSR
jgi:hypothetical protein